MIRHCNITDAEAICNIYNHYVLNSTSTFEVEPITVTNMEKRIKQYTGKNPWLVYQEDNKILGYAYANEWKSRVAYKHTKEVSIYITSSSGTKGIGTALYKTLIETIKKSSCHALVAIITLPNDPSTKFHEKFGFKKVAHLTEVGNKFNQWLDVGYWELIL